MEQKTAKYVYWIPRILSILFILFLTLISLDVFEGKQDFWGTSLGLLIHNIPTIILLGLLIISWKYEIIGGIGFILAGLFYIIITTITIIRSGFEWQYIIQIILIAGAPLITGILFTIYWFHKKN